MHKAMSTMSLLPSMDVDLSQSFDNQQTETTKLDGLFDDWILADSFNSTDSEENTDTSEHDLDFFTQLSSRLTQMEQERDDGPIVSVADLQSAREAEQAWQAIRTFNENHEDAASSQTPDDNPSTPSRHTTRAAHGLSLTTDFESPLPTLNGLLSPYTIPKTPFSSPKTPLSNFFDGNSLENLAICSRSRSPKGQSSRLKREPRPTSPSQMALVPQRRSLQSTQRSICMASATQHQNMFDSLITPTPVMPLNLQGIQGGDFEAAFRMSYSQSADVTGLENGFIPPQQTPVASSLFEEQSASNSSGSSNMGGYQHATSSQQITHNMLMTTAATSPAESSWTAAPAVSSPGFTSMGNTADGRWWNSESDVGAQRINNVRSPSHSSRTSSRMGLGIHFNTHLHHVESVNSAMLTGKQNAMKHRRDANAFPASQNLMGMNDMSRSIGQGIDLSTIPTDSASALSPHAFFDPAHMYPQMASPSRRSISAAYYSQASSNEARQHPNNHRASMPNGLPSPANSFHSPASKPSSKPPTHQHKRSRSNNTHRRPKSFTTSANTSPRHASLDFVNFTPNDSKKILTGVAPSGSSKTKMRREKEAAERRRRMGQQIEEAVQTGDVSALRTESFIALVKKAI